MANPLIPNKNGGAIMGLMSQARADRIRREGSPYYTYTPAIIVAAANDYIWLSTQFPLSQKYAPLDWFEIVNNSGENLIITINGNEQLIVPAATSRRSDLIPIHSFNILNNSITDTVAGEVVVTFCRQPMSADKLARESR